MTLHNLQHLDRVRRAGRDQGGDSAEVFGAEDSRGQNAEAGGRRAGAVAEAVHDAAGDEEGLTRADDAGRVVDGECDGASQQPRLDAALGTAIIDGAVVSFEREFGAAAHLGSRISCTPPVRRPQPFPTGYYVQITPKAVVYQLKAGAQPWKAVETWRCAPPE